MKTLINCLLIAIVLFVSCGNGKEPGKEDVIVPSERSVDLSVMFLNLWRECTCVTDAPVYLIDQVAYLKPDILMVCELFKAENDDPVIPKLISGLKAKGLTYYSARVDGRAIVSKYKITEYSKINSWCFKAVLEIKGQRVVVIPTHSEYRYYTCYYPRGYNDGVQNWDKLDAPILDVDKIVSVCSASGRPAMAQQVVDVAVAESRKGAVVFYGGDFNEPSHLDWQASTASLMDHNGCVVNWPTSSLLASKGFVDSYRQAHPDPVRFPGITFPANNTRASVDALSWAPEADERDRIDFIYYYSDPRIELKDAVIVGPRGSISRFQRVEESGEDTFVMNPDSGWPTDHKGVLCKYTINLNQ